MDEPGRRTATGTAPRPAGSVAGLSLGHRPHRPRGTARTNPRTAAVAHPLHPRIAPPGSPHAARHPPRVRTARNRIVEKPHAGADPRNHELAHTHPLAKQDPHLGRLHATVRPGAATAHQASPTGHPPPEPRPAGLCGKLPETDAPARPVLLHDSGRRAFQPPAKAVPRPARHLRPALSRLHLPGRPRANGAAAHQPGEERPRGIRPRRRDRSKPATRRGHRRGAPQCARPRHGHPRRRAGTHLRPLLHHQAGRLRHRPERKGSRFVLRIPRKGTIIPP